MTGHLEEFFPVPAISGALRPLGISKLPVDKVAGLCNGPPVSVVTTSREGSRGARSPDEEGIAFNSDRESDNMNLWMHPLAGGAGSQITQGPGGDYQPDWSPDGKSLVFFALRSGNADIWLVNVENGHPVGEPRRQAAPQSARSFVPAGLVPLRLATQR
ncbi:MAG: amidohydrolase [Acidobacteria bacterium]|nr:amidohydrolase [Acidobacteriota bacterium]